MRRVRLSRDDLSLRRHILVLAAVLAVNLLGLVAIPGSTSDIEAQDGSDTLTQSLWAGFNAVAYLGPNAEPAVVADEIGDGVLAIFKLVAGTFLSFHADPGENADSLNDLKVVATGDAILVLLADGIHLEWIQAIPSGLPQHLLLGPGFNFVVFTGPDNTLLADRFPAGGCISAIFAWDALPAAWLGFPLGQNLAFNAVLGINRLDALMILNSCSTATEVWFVDEMTGEGEGETQEPAAPAISLTKINDGPAPLGGIITYTYTVGNTGNTTLTAVSVVDDPLGPITISDTAGNGVDLLEPGDVETGAATHTVTEIDITNGTVVNVATATGTTPDGRVTATASNTVPLDPPPSSQTGTIEVVKALIPSNDPGRFGLLIDGAVRTAKAGDGDTTAAVTVNAGDHTVSEIAYTGTAEPSTDLADYVTTLTCVNSGAGSLSLPSDVLVTGSPASFTLPTLPAGADIVCTFTNTRRGTINITKDTQPDHAQDFDFEDDITGTINGSPDFTLDDDVDANLSNTKNFSQVAPNNTYTVSETAVLGWTLSDITCTGSSFIYRPSGGATFAAGDTSVEIMLAPGDIVNCTFTNTNTPPVIDGGATAAFSVPENTTAVADIDATDDSDAEGAGLTYSLTGSVDDSLFRIDPATGVLSFITPPDFEAMASNANNNIYVVTVTVTDSGGLTDVQTVTVTVTDGNEAPSLLSEGGGALPTMISLPENTPRVIQNIESSDPEGETEFNGLVYSMIGVDVAKFIIGQGGKFSFKAPFLPDFENPMDVDGNNVYEVTVIVTDSGGLTDTQDISVTITDANDPPRITTTTLMAQENQTSAGTVLATDLEPGTLTFSITGGADSGAFSITSAGVLTFDVAPNFEAMASNANNNSYEVEVTVTDDGVSPSMLTDVRTITVTVTNVNEAPSLLNEGGEALPEMIFLEENSTSLILIQNIEPSDPEGETDSGGGLLYTLSGDDVSKFILPEGGKFSFARPSPDFENPGDADGDNVYKVTITVTDSLGLTDTHDISVTVTDVDGE